MGDPEDQLRAGELLWVLAREGIHLQGVPFVVVIEIGNLLADGIAKGLASQTIAMQIAPLLDGDLKRALLIVRTERARAMSGAEYANAKAAGDYDKEWMDDEIACPICRANAAQGAISMTQPFSSGDLYPPAHPNCRCALQTVAHQATTEKTLMPNDVVYAVIGTINKSKTDDGVLTFLASKTTGPDLDADGHRVNMDWARKSMREWFETGGNLREQHDMHRAVGKALTLEERADGLYISGKIVDPISIRKVQEGVLTDLSIGIRGGRVSNGEIIDGRIVECSLVDRGSNPTTKLILAKADGPDGHMAVVGEFQKYNTGRSFFGIQTADQLLKAVRADPVTWRRRLGVDAHLQKMEQEVADLQRQLDLVNAIPLPPPHRFAAQNGHSTTRRTP